MIDANGQKWIKCGLALLDMDIRDHLKLISMLHQAKDKNSYICNEVDLVLNDRHFCIVSGDIANLSECRGEIGADIGDPNQPIGPL